MYSNEQCHPAKIYQACACTKPCMFLPDDRANARTSKKSLICEMHCGVYTIIYNVTNITEVKVNMQQQFDEGVDSWKSVMFLYNSALKEVSTKLEILNDEKRTDMNHPYKIW